MKTNNTPLAQGLLCKPSTVNKKWQHGIHDKKNYFSMKFLLNCKKDKKPLVHNRLLIMLRIFLRKNISNHLFLYMPCEFPLKKTQGVENGFFF